MKKQIFLWLFSLIFLTKKLLNFKILNFIYDLLKMFVIFSNCSKMFQFNLFLGKNIFFLECNQNTRTPLGLQTTN